MKNQNKEGGGTVGCCLEGIGHWPWAWASSTLEFQLHARWSSRGSWHTATHRAVGNVADCGTMVSFTLYMHDSLGVERPKRTCGHVPACVCVLLDEGVECDTPGRGVGFRLGGGLHTANGGFGFVSLI